MSPAPHPRTPCNQVFNSRATQLVLGAGAIHSTAKLKSISAKHLALCSQSLGLVRAVIPLLTAALATRLPQKHHLLLAQMDAVAQVRSCARLVLRSLSERSLGLVAAEPRAEHVDVDGCGVSAACLEDKK